MPDLKCPLAGISMGSQLRLTLLALACATGLGTAPTLAADQGSAPLRAVEAFNDLFGKHPGYRAVHAKGIVCEGIFRPSPEAAAVSRAVHFQGGDTRIVVRFSDFAGVPTVADGSDLASPRGMSIKFVLPDGGDTDIVAHSYDGFPVATAEDFVDFLQAIRASGPDSPSPTALETFALAHPAAKRFLETPKPIPVSYASETFFGVNAFGFIDAAGTEIFGRYSLVPVGGTAYLAPEEAGARAPDFLAAELAERLNRGAITFRLMLQLSAPGDDVTDGTAPWPAERRMVELGQLVLQRIADDNRETERELLFTPLNLVDGIGPSGDPLLAARSRAYVKSYSYRSRP